MSGKLWGLSEMWIQKEKGKFDGANWKQLLENDFFMFMCNAFKLHNKHGTFEQG
jgi:hypothetical protein